ncbi:MAG: class I tRNA ligase family protein, partial [Desulfotomaculales bacterium]
PLELVEKYGVDAVRYYLLREMPLGVDVYYSEEALIERINKDLANDFGNLVSRTLGLLERYFQGTVPVPAGSAGPDRDLIDLALATPGAVEEMMEKRDLAGALAAIWRLVGRANKYVDETAPWALRKDPAMQARLQTVLYNLSECVRFLGVLVSPFLPLTPPRLWPQLGIDGRADLQTWESLQWGKLPPGTAVRRAEALFPRIDPEAALKRREGS